MSLFDQALIISEHADTTLTTTVAVIIATHTIDTWRHADSSGVYASGAGVTPRGGPHLNDLGAALPMHILVVITEAVVGTSSTVSFRVVQCDAAAGTGNVEILDVTKAIPEAKLTLGKMLAFRVPNMNRRFLSMNYDVAANTTTAGKCVSGLVPALPSNVPGRYVDQT